MKVVIFGLGYVGLTAAGCLTREDHQVLGIDVNEEKVSQINAGLTPILEPGLDGLITNARAHGLLRATVKADRSDLDDAQVVLVCVGTPSAFNGAHDLSHIAEVSRQIADGVNAERSRPLTVAYRSTIRPGTIEGLVFPIFENLLGKGAPAVSLVYNPEFLRESSAINDYFNPPKIVIGTADGAPNTDMDELYANIDAPVFYTRYREAEFTKFVDNSFHALKVAYANEIGRICLHQGISARTVHEIFVADTKLNISPYYLRPGGPFGGSCLPKDVRALQYISAQIGANTQIIDSIIRSNEAHKHSLYEMCSRGLEPGARVLMVGLAFKAHTDDLRESPNIDLACKFMEGGYALSIYDPSIDATKLVGQNSGYAFSHLPNLSSLLVAKHEVESRIFDLAVDSNGTAGKLAINAARIVDIAALP